MPNRLDATSLHALLQSFLNEDIGAGDLTTESTVPASLRARGEVVSKATLVLAGIEIFAEVFRLLDPSAAPQFLHRDGDALSPGDIPARVQASARALLTGERVALNFLQRLCGIATLTRRFVQAVDGTKAAIVETRKTTPGLRTLEKYAVRVGGGENHRNDLGDAILIKDNHIRLAGGVSAALEAAQTARGRARWLEIEVTNTAELRAALEHQPDMILLDNMSPGVVRQAVEEIGEYPASKKIRTEASGGISLQNVREFAEAGVDWISVGALTHSAPAMDLSFEIEPE